MMKKRVLAGLFTIAFLFALISTSYASEVPDTVESAAADENAQVHTLPVVRNEADAPSLMSLNDVAPMSTGVNPVITSALSEDFYADADEFEIKLYIENMLDTRQHLTLKLVDANGATIAQQRGVYYHQNGLVYQMELVGTVDAYSDYSVQFNYDDSGKYELEYETSNVSIYPITNVAIKSIEAIDYLTNSFRLVLANAEAGTSYTLMYAASWSGTPVIREATVASDKSIIVEFGDSLPFSEWNYIFLCPSGSTTQNESIDSTTLYDLNSSVPGSGISNNGVYCSDYISTTATSAWFNLYEKGFGNQSYSAADVENINV